MSKGMTIKDAIKIWEEKHPQAKSDEAEVVKLIGVTPSITKLDAGLAALTKVKYEFLTILSLGRNNIKKIEGLEPVADTLQELWLSYNQIERVNGIECCKKLKVVYMSNNKVKAWDGIDKLKELPALEEILLQGNPLEEKLSAEGTWRDEVSKKYPVLKKLDGKPIIRDDEVTDDAPPS